MPSPLLQSVNRQNLEPGMHSFQQSVTTKPEKTLNQGAQDKFEIKKREKITIKKGRWCGHVAAGLQQITSDNQHYSYRQFRQSQVRFMKNKSAGAAQAVMCVGTCHRTKQSTHFSLYISCQPLPSRQEFFIQHCNSCLAFIGGFFWKGTSLPLQLQEESYRDAAAARFPSVHGSASVKRFYHIA